MTSRQSGGGQVAPAPLLAVKSFSSGHGPVTLSPERVVAQLEDDVRRDDLESTINLFGQLRKAQQHQTSQRANSFSQPVEEPSVPLPRPFTSLVLALSLGRTGHVQYFLRQPEVDGHTKIWAASYLQLPHLVQDLLKESHGRQAGADKDTTWIRLWASCAIGRVDSINAILSSMEPSKIGQLLNKGHDFDGMTPLGISLHFGHLESVSLPLLRQHADLIDTSKTDLKGRSYFHLAVLSSSLSPPQLSGIPSGVSLKKAARVHSENLPEVISALSKQGTFGVIDIAAEAPVRGERKTVWEMLMEMQRLTSVYWRRQRYFYWRHLCQFHELEAPFSENGEERDDGGQLSKEEQHWRHQDRLIKEDLCSLEKSQCGLGECLKRILELFPDKVAALTDFEGFCTETCEAGAWGNKGLLELLLSRPESKELAKKNLGLAFICACELGSTHVAGVIVSKILSSKSDLTQVPALPQQLLTGVKLAVVHNREAFLIKLCDSLGAVIEKMSQPVHNSHRHPTGEKSSNDPSTAGFSPITDWNSSKPEGASLLHLLVNFGMSGVVQKILSLPDLARHFDFNKQCDLRTSQDVQRDDLPTTAKIHRTACLTLGLAAIRLKWLKSSLVYYDSQLQPRGASIQGQPKALSPLDPKGQIPAPVLEGRMKILVCLLQQERVSLKFQGLGNESLLVHEAARCGNFAAMLALLERCPSLDVNQVDYLGRSVPYYAVRHGSVPAVQYLVELGGVEFNRRARDGSFPLQLATENNMVEIARLLLAGPSSHLIDPNLPIVQTRSWKQLQAGGVILDVFSLSVAPVLARRKSLEEVSGQTVLHLACSLNHTEISRELVAHPDIDINAATASGTTALATAALCGAVECVRELLVHPSLDLWACDAERSTAFHLAAKNEHEGIVGLLIDAADPLLLGEDILETIVRFCPAVLKERLDGSVWKETLSRSSSEFCYVCDWRAAFMSEGVARPASDSKAGRQLPRVSFLLKSVVAYKAGALLETPLLRTAVDLKWRRYRLFGYLSLALYLLYLACFTMMTLAPPPLLAGVTSPVAAFACELGLLVLSTVFLLFDLFTFVVANSELVANDWELPRCSQRALFHLSLFLRKVVSYGKGPEHWARLFTFGTSFLYALHSTFPSVLAATPSSSGSGQQQFSSSAEVALPGYFSSTLVPLAVLTAWLLTLSFLRSVSPFGLRIDLHVQMYFQVIKSMLSSVLLFAVILTGFGVTLVILTTQAPQVPLGYPSPNATSADGPRLTLLNSLKVLVFTSFGDLQFVEQLAAPDDPAVVQVAMVVLIVFLVMVPLVAFNFLVALAVGDVNTLLLEARMEGLRTRASTVATLDHLLASSRVFGFLRVDLPSDGRIFPNRRGFLATLLSFLGLAGEGELCSYDIPHFSAQKRAASKKLGAAK